MAIVDCICNIVVAVNFNDLLFFVSRLGTFLNSVLYIVVS